MNKRDFENLWLLELVFLEFEFVAAALFLSGSNSFFALVMSIILGILGFVQIRRVENL